MRVTATVNGERRTQPKDLREWLTNYVASFGRASKRVKSVYLYGERKGTGKTTTACALLGEWLATYYLRSVQAGETMPQRPALFFDVNEWLIEYNLIAMGNDSDEVKAFKTKMESAAHVPFLVMDDLGVRKFSENFRGYLHYIVNYRCANGLPTVYTSNIPLDDLAEVFDERLADRVRDMCFEVTWPDDAESKRGIR